MLDCDEFAKMCSTLLQLQALLVEFIYFRIVFLYLPGSFSNDVHMISKVSDFIWTSSKRASFVQIFPISIKWLALFPQTPSSVDVIIAQVPMEQIQWIRLDNDQTTKSSHELGIQNITKEILFPLFELRFLHLKRERKRTRQCDITSYKAIPFFTFDFAE